MISNFPRLRGGDFALAVWTTRDGRSVAPILHYDSYNPVAPNGEEVDQRIYIGRENALWVDLGTIDMADMPSVFQGRVSPKGDDEYPNSCCMRAGLGGRAFAIAVLARTRCLALRQAAAAGRGASRSAAFRVGMHGCGVCGHMLGPKPL